MVERKGREMIEKNFKELVWEENDGAHYSSGAYTLIKFDDGFLVDFDDLSLGHGFTLEEAKQKAAAYEEKKSREDAYAQAKIA
jgi:hypothetical protein